MNPWKSIAVLAATLVVLTGCADDASDRSSDGASDPASASSIAPADDQTTTPASPAPDEAAPADCSETLEAAVEARFPGYTPIALDRCGRGWAYLGSAGTAGDTETLWRVVDDQWQWVTSMPSELCPVDLEDMGAPTWVVHLLDYREYAC